MEVQGVIIQLGDSQQVTDKFKKRQVVVETDEKYVQKLQSILSKIRPAY